MATPEGKIKTWLDKMLKEEGIWSFSPQAGPYGKSGIPDRIAIVSGQFLGIECKADASKKPTALQERCMADIMSAGGMCFVVYDKETIERVRQYIVNARNSRQESISVVHGKPCGCPVCHPDSEARARLHGGSPPPVRRDEGSAQPWV